MTFPTLIDFPKEKWAATKDRYEKWWRGELGRPLLALTVAKENRPSITEPELSARHFHAHYGLTTPMEKIIERIDYDLSQRSYLGDAFPATWANYGPGVVAAFLGCELHNSEETVWFHPRHIVGIADIHLSTANISDNPWFKRVMEFCALANERWQGRVQVGMTDLGGNLDILSAFRPAEHLLLDLYDYPEEVMRLTWEAHRAWWECFERLHEKLPCNPGYSAWTPIFSEQPYYMLQCDFCYMISPEMFDEFVKPELTASCARLGHAFYHLDGPGQLSHLDSLLSVDELDGIQWVPGDGQPKAEEWTEVYARIKEAGKKIQIFTSQCRDWPSFLDALAEQIGELDNLILIGEIDPLDLSRAGAVLEKYGCA